MGDTGGKKEKNKSQKQMIQRRDQMAKRKQDQQQKRIPYQGASFRCEKSTVLDGVRSLRLELQKDRGSNRAPQGRPNGAPEGWR